MTPLLKDLAFLFAFIGFGTKAGIVPFHIWLPYAHPAAPSNVSALMSGVMIKTAIFMLIRISFDFLGASQVMVGLYCADGGYDIGDPWNIICSCGTGYEKNACIQQHRKYRDHPYRYWRFHDIFRKRKTHSYSNSNDCRTISPVEPFCF